MSKIATSRKVHVILTKYFISINEEHNVIYLQNTKFEQLIVWSGGAYTDAAHGRNCKIFKIIYNFFFTEIISTIPWL